MSGLVGGVCKSFDLPNTQLLNITFDGSITVVAYAVLSASAGYITKYIFDQLKKKFRNGQ